MNQTELAALLDKYTAACEERARQPADIETAEREYNEARAAVMAAFADAWAFPVQSIVRVDGDDMDTVFPAGTDARALLAHLRGRYELSFKKTTKWTCSGGAEYDVPDGPVGPSGGV